MTAPETTGTAVAEPRGIGALPLEIQQQIQLRKMMGMVAAELGKLNWGEKLEETTRRAVAEWGRRYNIDVATEIDVLGNRIYPNAKYYLRRLGGLIEEGLVQYAYSDHVHADERLAKLGEDGAKEATRRLMVRARYNVPEDAKGAVVFRVKLHSMEREVVGVNWTGEAARSKADPVGNQEPAKTAESRAARRCLRQLVAHVPKVSNEIEVMMADVKQIEGRIQVDHETLKAQGPEKGPTHIPASTDPYLLASRPPTLEEEEQANRELDLEAARQDEGAA